MRKQQRWFVCLVGISLLLGACQRRPILPTPTPIDTNRSATLSEAINVVEARDADAPGFLAASVGRVVTTGGEVRTGDNSKARLDLNDASIVRLAQNSAFTVTGLPAPGSANPVTQLKLTIGKIWVSLTGGTLEVETPVGVATVRGSFAVFEYVAGDPNDPNDDILIVSCLEGNCSASNQSVNESLGNLEQVILTNGGQTVVRFNLSEADVQAFLQDNPEAARLVATLTAAAPGPTNTAQATATNTASPITQTTITSTPTPTPSRTLTAPPSATGPAFVILGRHVVQSGETLLCVARGYGVLPNAIALANGLVSPFTLIPGQALGIPAVQWVNISPGPVCPPQFRSPYPGLPTVTFTSSPMATATSTPTNTPTVPTNTPAPVTSTFTPIPASPTLTSTPSVTPSPTLSPTPTNTPTITPTPDTIPPAVSRFSASPTFADQGQGTCQVTFSALVDDLGTVASAMVEWTAYDFLATPTPTGTGSVPMALASGTTTSGTWQVSFTVQIPPYGSLQWNVRATDLGGNAVVQPSGVNIVSGTGGCP